MTISKTVLEWPYHPADFFEASYRQTAPGYDILVDAGIVAVTLSCPQDPISETLKSQIASKVEAILRIRQLQTHRQYQLENHRTRQSQSNGTASVSIAISGVSVICKAGTADVIVTDAAGNLVHDSKAERIAADTRFIDELSPKVCRSSLLESLLRSYGAAVNDSADELTHLYEIRDALARHYGGKRKARKNLNIPNPDWNRLGYLADVAPLAQSRHRGKHLASMRPATHEELEEARQIARRLILAYAGTI
jgi:hypothetical protein